ncbi:MAG: c-type cytochrome [Opitutaceae bacterium]|nr:c-type cytochrome [Opitutaceae bacterium]
MRLTSRRVVVLSCALICIAAELCAGDAAKKQSGRGQWWREIDTGPFISDTIFTAPKGEVAALKGLAIKVGARREATLVFDTELLCWRAGFEGGVLLAGTPWDGGHGGNTHYPPDGGIFFFQNPTGRGAAAGGDWRDGREGAAGPLPHDAARYRGLFRHGSDVVLHYTVGGVDVHERPALESFNAVRALTRTVNVAATPAAEIELLVATAGAGRLKTGVAVQLAGAPVGVTLRTVADGRTVVAIARGTPASRFVIVYAEGPIAAEVPAADLASLRRGGPGLFPQTFAVKGQLDPQAATRTYAVDTIPLPSDNPWKSPPRFGGFDFFPDGKRLAASTWNGDVWIAEGIDGDLSKVTWRRFASGMFQTLGLKIVDGIIYTQGRDQITRLHDLNGDGEADHYECFNNDVQITTGFHEFSFDLETDREGNFYFSKGMPVNQGGRGFAPWTSHNGAVLKVSKDGSKLERVAWGLRAPGGLGVSPDGVITTGENEGSWVPACKISWTPPGRVTFNGVVPGTWERSEWRGPLPGAPADYDRPLCWLPYAVDNSSGSQAWVPAATTWDPRHAGEMLHLSYGKSGIFRVLRDEFGGVVQGGVYRLPIEVSAAVMRARFHPVNGQLYAAGFRGWQTNGRDAIHRIRFTGVTRPVPIGLRAHANGVVVEFSAPLDPTVAADPARYSISKWNYVWGPQYGSGRFSIDQRDEAAEAKALTAPSKGSHNIIDPVAVAAARLLDDGRSVFLYVPRMTPAMQLELKLDLADAKGARVRETIYHTVHALRPDFTVPAVRWEEIKVAATGPVGEPGLALSFNSEITDTVRVDQLALTVPEGASPSVFITARGGSFGAAWQGSLIVPERDDYTFSFEGNGHVTLQIGGRTILSGDLPLTAQAPVTLAKGAHAIYASYKSPRAGESRVRLLWSSPQFRPEPVPATAFRFLPPSEMQAWTKAREGREVFTAAMCVRCHQSGRGGLPADVTPELRVSAPDFAAIGSRLEPGWIEQWVGAPQGYCPTVAPRQAGDVAAYLAAQRAGGEAATPLPADAATIAAGAGLVAKLHLGFWIEPLAQARKHTDAGLVGFLREPARHHADTVFPDVRLSETEARQIAGYVRSRQPAAARASGGDAAAGAAIVARACAACHGPDAGAGAAPMSLEQIAVSDWTVRGCVAENRGSAPDYRFTPGQVSALIALRNADRDVGMQSLRRFAPAEYAAAQLKALNCAQCHAGGGEHKVPDIALAGEKFQREWLTQLIAGGLAEKIRPWQEARMPAFASRAANLALGLAAKHGVPAKTEPARTAPDLIAAGGQLAGEGGYACIACHDAGGRKALQVFEGQGPNLRLAAERLRPDYYQRWMHWPQRIDPATIMPRYTKDRDHALLDTHFGGDAERQFEAVWQWARSLK